MHADLHDALRRYPRRMTTTALTSVDRIELAVGDRQITLTPSPGIELRLTVDSIADDPAFDLLDHPRPPKLHVAVCLIPSGADAIMRSEAQATAVAAELGAHDSPLAPLREFSLEAALSGEDVPYHRVSIPRLTLLPGEPPVLDEDQPLPGVRVFTATTHEVAPGRRVKLTYKE